MPGLLTFVAVAAAASALASLVDIAGAAAAALAGLIEKRARARASARTAFRAAGATEKPPGWWTARSADGLSVWLSIYVEIVQRPEREALKVAFYHGAYYRVSGSDLRYCCPSDPYLSRFYTSCIARARAAACAMQEARVRLDTRALERWACANVEAGEAYRVAAAAARSDGQRADAVDEYVSAACQVVQARVRLASRRGAPVLEIVELYGAPCPAPGWARSLRAQ